MSRGDITNELELKQFIPRGSVLKYSQETQAIVVYTGIETKLVLNQGKYSTKVSHIMYKLNTYMLINICTMFFQAIVMSLICNRIWMSNNASFHYYIFPKGEDIDVNLYSIKAFASFYLIFNGLIPLDLSVTFILVKLCYLFRLTGDPAMVDEESSCAAGEIKGCKVKNLEIL
jgi:magnesium-transporting ATPase (P-type)